MRVLVTGGAGYIGSVVTEQLLASKHEVTVFDDLSKGHPDAVRPGAELVKGDMLDEKRLNIAALDSPTEGFGTFLPAWRSGRRPNARL